MKRSVSIACATLLFLGGVTLASPAYADENNVLETLASVSPEVLDSAASVSTTPGTQNAINASLENTQITVPADAQAGVIVNSGTTLNIGLPFARQADTATVERQGIVSYDNNNGSETVPVIHDDGTVQLNTIIRDPQAPKSYSYPLELPSGSSLVAHQGGAQIRDDNSGDVIGEFDAPWAFDADGQSVPTHYEINGSTLTQIVAHGTESRYPIVADPSYKTYT
ncbi:hypothetical protein GCM10022198_01810 [Klugiella xanthotipulae]|uniref:Uncharacterized protein n=1 Tax=Klugiella xanthotipulae TaxID=244735 RepID=A0A543I504_9MICO|nr:hypothetical protein [Klugiella xanthotipulae]TQM65683.1 hypothetical protein FB466_0494 [Klugiella xanthotipulae]